MAVYTPHTTDDVKSMLASIGAQDIDELFSAVPKHILNLDNGLGDGLSEIEVDKIVSRLANKNKVYDIVLRGAGAYQHFIPSAVKKMADRSEFVTAYTPYQAELSQGILQSIFEYQTMVAELTGMDVSNASHYDGATGVAEAILMLKDKKKNKVLLAPNVAQETVDVAKTYAPNIVFESVDADKDGRVDLADLEAKLTDDVFVFYLENPSSVGIIEYADKIGEIVKSKKVKFLMKSYPISLGLLKNPRECGADVAVMEGQPLGLDLAFGGPYLGIMTATKEFARKLPGRIVGKTLDRDGKTAYVLTLQAREQHIRREKASSNICSNQAHCALRAGMYLSFMGADGLKSVANQCVSNAHYLLSELEKIGFARKHKAEFFNEFVTVSTIKADDVLSILDKNNILGGLKIGENEILWCCTETVSKDDIDRVVKIVGGAL